MSFGESLASIVLDDGTGRNCRPRLPRRELAATALHSAQLIAVSNPRGSGLVYSVRAGERLPFVGKSHVFAIHETSPAAFYRRLTRFGYCP